MKRGCNKERVFFTFALFDSITSSKLYFFKEYLMKLYFSPGACSLSPHIVVREAELPFELERVDLRTKKTELGTDYKTINPKGYVPALQLDNGQILTEGPSIVQYLADLAPNKHLAPTAGSIERYHLMEWLNFISTELHKSFGLLFNPNLPDQAKTFARELLNARIGFVATHLAHTPYINGNQFSVADAYLFTVLNWCDKLHIDLSPWLKVKRICKK
jgi:glutathione S-transferase